ncbi:hypothetical protein SCHPADRAFT_916964 [Schizopora paradoxa]|uniref:Uncharacterized protein n=1 Tax=Schizopora paradoxa TaxID=27342 RepID=A0A0H2R925_9AGAM|nr:hypothetical protein SCHPADRAFT_916964 [Schizopora paradoxa]
MSWHSRALQEGIVRQGDWPHRRVVGKQFPPYGDSNPDSWGVQHAMHPTLDEPAFVRWYTSDAVVDVVKQLLGREEGDLQMELSNLLINPESHSALHEDSCLFVVPGSHKQRALSETPDASKNPLDIPGAIQVTLQPGETYDARAQRATLHPCMGDAELGGTVRARNILQHGIVDWVAGDAFEETLTTERARKMRERLLEMARMADEKGVGVGYSSNG